jgi:hypothetical protein
VWKIGYGGFNLHRGKFLSPEGISRFLAKGLINYTQLLYKNVSIRRPSIPRFVVLIIIKE